MPLSELEVAKDAPGYQMVDDYITWFVNAPETSVDDDLDGGPNEDEESEDEDDPGDEHARTAMEDDLGGKDWDDEEDELGNEPAQDYEDEPPPARQKVGRNDPCPCGSGKKFKKCCLGKEPLRQQEKTRSEFPIGTIALYGPDDKRTTKIAAGVIKRKGADAILKRWVGTNVKDDPKVRREIQEFFKKHGVKSVAATDRNMGCPHEEGEDFPDGGDCPFCPWWKGKQGSGAKE
ncbi:MAG: SEC-C metal-binding domain-containing protein [Thermoguttaceae bacterium]